MKSSVSSRQLLQYTEALHAAQVLHQGNEDDQPVLKWVSAQIRRASLLGYRPTGLTKAQHGSRCTLTNGSAYFSDADRTNHPARFYRLRSP